MEIFLYPQKICADLWNNIEDIVLDIAGQAAFKIEWRICNLSPLIDDLEKYLPVIESSFVPLKV